MNRWKWSLPLMRFATNSQPLCWNHTLFIIQIEKQWEQQSFRCHFCLFSFPPCKYRHWIANSIKVTPFFCWCWAPSSDCKFQCVCVLIYSNQWYKYSWEEKSNILCEFMPYKFKINKEQFIRNEKCMLLLHVL